MTLLRTLSAALLLIGVAACGDRAPAPQGSTRRDSTRDSTGLADGTIPDSAAKPEPTRAARITAPPTDSMSRSRRKTSSPPDSAILLQIATQPKSRTMADSISLVATIRAGLKHHACQGNEQWLI